MGLFSHKRANVPVRPEAKWDYIQLDDFKSSGIFTYMAYGYVFISLTISMAVYAVDTFTAVNLLAFNKWSSEIQPAISFDITKWIFAVCIILSFVNVGYEHIRANIIIRRGSVAESYLDSLAVRLQSARVWNGKGWRRFLVFAELTKSKKGAEYIALFTYFSLQAWIRVIFCSGPRQVVNAVTLYSVYTAKLQIDGDSFESSFENFFSKIKALAQQDYQQALILSGMVFTLVIWVFSALSLIIGVLFFVTFLWGWIPKEDGGLSGYCERKINKRLMKIVSAKVEAALADQERKRKKAEMKAAKKAGALPPEERKATLPTLMSGNDDKLAEMPSLYRNDTVATLPVYTPREGTPGQDYEMNKIRPMPSRSETSTTASSRAPLLTAGADMGMASPGMPSPNYSSRSGTMRSDTGPYNPSPLQRTQTNNSSFSGSAMGPPQLSRVQTNDSSFAGSTMGALSRTQTNNSGYKPYSQSPDDSLPPMPQVLRSPTAVSNVSYGMPARTTPAPMGSYDEYFGRSASPAPSRQMPSRPMLDDYPSGRSSPAPTVQSRSGGNGYGPTYGQGSYPNRSQTGPVPYRGPAGPGQPQRNMTAPAPQQYGAYQPQTDEYFNRPGTAQSQRGMTGRPAPPEDWFDRPGTAQSQRTNMTGSTQAPSSQPRQYQAYGGAYSDLESQRGTPGPRY